MNETANIIVLTDCEDLKYDAIEGVFKGNLKGSQLRKTAKIFREDAPVSIDDLFSSIERRLDMVVASFHEGVGTSWYATIQKGFFLRLDRWYLGAGVGIQRPDGQKSFEFAASVQMPDSVSEEMNPGNKKIYEALLKKFPYWDKRVTSIFTLLTKEDEKMWLQQPLRYAIRSLLDW